MTPDEAKRQYQDLRDHDLLVEAVIDIKAIKDNVDKVCICVFGNPDADDTGLKGKVEKLNVRLYYAFAGLTALGTLVVAVILKLMGG